MVVEVEVWIVLGAQFSVNMSYSPASGYFLPMAAIVVFVGGIFGA